MSFFHYKVREGQYAHMQIHVCVDASINRIAFIYILLSSSFFMSESKYFFLKQS
jgi:hypothetical protein